ncbi:PREDICTED: trophoblast glycoprotein [Poecilia mexicana]|uniref:trophoblast glycoprotein n=1 Tax=Poecilia mexicana TaxID=48701 RepID=UPI00072E4901|nr:PREDICTED: trophoblast glycoprotein [Poecilia mexicana]
MRPGRPHKSGMTRLLLLLALALSCRCCPDKCLCTSETVKCQNQGLVKIPPSLPAKTKSLFVTGNRIAEINDSSFPTRLENLAEMYLSGNEMEDVLAGAFKNLPNLVQLDLSNNIIQNFSESAFPDDSKLQFLNLSRSLNNYTTLDFFVHANLPNLTSLDLSNNDLLFLPDGMFKGLPSLTTLNLRNSSLIMFQSVDENEALLALRHLDLRDNHLKNLPAATMVDFGLRLDLRVQLAGNPWRCNCFISDLLAWLKNSTQVVDARELTCADPEAVRDRPLLQVQQSQLKCSSDMEGVLETSYVFLGLVLALIGVIFLLVLYLNRKGIKRWMYNIRDACRDHMEGYHYRYEINSDPRLANLSINSDV